MVKGEYEKCTFNNCDFSDSDLSEIRFSECEFIACNLSMAKLTKTAFRDVIFKNCKMLGLHFENCNEFDLLFRFENCVLNFSSFYKSKLKRTVFKNCQLQEVDFTESDMINSLFDNCDLALSIFENTIIEKADFRTSFNYSIDPEMNRIKKARFSIPRVVGLLHKYDIEIDR